MKKLTVVLSLVFLASCGDDELSSCTEVATNDAYNSSHCVLVDDNDGQEVGDNQVQCSVTNDDKEYSCVKPKKAEDN